MKIKRIIEQEAQVEIIGITLLSAKEVEKLPDEMMQYNSWWWLRSPGNYSDYAVFVDCDGSVYNYGCFVDDSRDAVRPALLYKSKNLKIGDIIYFGDKEWKVIDDKYAFCTTDIGNCRFDERSNNYDKSEIKQYIEKWYRRVDNDRNN